MLTGAICSVPYANAAIAWAPPTAYISSALLYPLQRVFGSMLYFLTEGEHAVIRLTPATFAGMVS